MIRHSDLSDTDLHSLIRRGELRLAGNRNLKIYGMLQCSSGKRMKRANRVFFRDEEDAISAGYRACKKCISVRTGNPKSE